MYYYSNYLRVVYDGIQSECHRQNANVWNATDICVWGFGVGGVFLYCGFGHWRFISDVLSRDPVWEQMAPPTKLHFFM